MKILVVTNLYPTNDRPFVSQFVKEQVESLRKNFPELKIDVRIIEGERPRWSYLKEMLLLPSVVKKKNYDIIHIHFGLSLVSVLLVRSPVVVTFHGSDLLISPTKYLSKILSPKATKIIVVSKKLKDCIGSGEVIPCGISVKEFALPVSYSSRKSPTIPGKIRILFPSNPSRKEKDYSLFEAVCDELEKYGNQIEKVILIDIKRTAVPDLYWNCDLMLLTSLSEGSPTVIKEAIAAKLPFVSVDVGDVNEWVNLIDFGIVVPKRDAKTIADMAISLLNNVKSRSSLNNSNCIKKIDNAEIAKRIKSVYDEILNNTD